MDTSDTERGDSGQLPPPPTAASDVVTEEDWAVIRGRWERGESYRTIAKDYPLAFQAIAKRRKRDGWERLTAKRPESKSMRPVVPLRPDERAAVDAWFRSGGIPTLAAQEIGTTVTELNKILKKDKVKREIQATQDRLKHSTDASAARVIQELASIAFFDVREMLNDDGSLKPIDQWPATAGAAVAQITERQSKGKGSSLTVKLWSKPDTLRQLVTVLGMVQPEQHQHLHLHDLAHVPTDRLEAAYELLSAGDVAVDSAGQAPALVVDEAEQ